MKLSIERDHTMLPKYSDDFLRILTKLFKKTCSTSTNNHINGDQEYFQKGFKEPEIFRDNFPERIALEGKSVLDFGCGYGSSVVRDEHRIEQNKFVNGIDEPSSHYK